MEIELLVIKKSSGKKVSAHDVTFYNIDFVEPAEEDSCVISSGGKLFTIAATYDNVRSLIRHFNDRELSLISNT